VSETRPEHSPLTRVVDEAVEERVDDAVEERVDEAVEERVDEAVEERVGEALQQADASAQDADQARAVAQQAQAGAEQAEVGAREAGASAVAAASLVAPPDDPVLETAVRRIEDNPFGRPGRPLAPRSPFRVAFSAALGVAVAYGLVRALISVQSVLVLLLTAAFLAIGLNPAVEALERRRLRRPFAVAVVLSAVLLFFVGFGFAVVPPIVEQAQAFVEAAPDYVRRLQDNGRIASLDERFGLLQRAQDVVADPERIGLGAAGGVLGVGRAVFGFFASTLVVFIVTLYFLANLPSIKAQAYRLVPRSRRARVGLLTDEILTRVGGYVAGAVSIASLNTGLVPLIGATIGAAILTAVAMFSSVQDGIIIAVWFVVYQQLENYLLYPRIMQRSVDVSPAATVVAVLVGGALLGVLGALLAIPIAAAVQLVLAEVVAPRQDSA
jgi:predicted PurR-regulated permease PerM